MAQIASWIGTLAFSTSFVLLLFLFDLLLRLATPLGRRTVERVGVLFQRALVGTYRLAGARVFLEIAPGFEPGRSYIALSNHQSMFDIPLLAWAIPRNFPKYISKQSLARWIPGISYNLRHGGHALIDRSDRESSVRAIRKLARAVVDDGSTVVIFPEGTRRRDGTMAPFKPAGTLALLDEAPDAPVLPICIHNSWRIMENNLRPVPWGIQLRMWIGTPIEREPGEDRMALMRRAEEEIHDTLARFRSLD
jgi:1-acyl-sn-glycerol-3-phosphate acyltransferase